MLQFSYTAALLSPLKSTEKNTTLYILNGDYISPFPSNKASKFIISFLKDPVHFTQ